MVTANLSRPCFRRNRVRDLIVGILFLLAVDAIAKPTLPDGWIGDYDYKEPLATYLKRQYESALDRNLVPYVYLYADWCPPCVTLRNRALKEPEFARVFAGTQIVALDFDSLKFVKDKPSFLTIGAPLIVAIESDGTLGKSAVNGIPWERRLPGNISDVLCSFFGARSIPSVVVDRGCPSPGQKN